MDIMEARKEIKDIEQGYFDGNYKFESAVILLLACIAQILIHIHAKQQ